MQELQTKSDDFFMKNTHLRMHTKSSKIHVFSKISMKNQKFAKHFRRREELLARHPSTNFYVKRSLHATVTTVYVMSHTDTHTETHTQRDTLIS